MKGCAVRKYGVMPYFNCKLHGSLTSRSRLAGGGCKPVYAAKMGSHEVVNDTLKGSFNCQVRIQEMNVSELLKRRRNTVRRCQNQSIPFFFGTSAGATCLLPARHPAYRQHELYSG